MHCIHRDKSTPWVNSLSSSPLKVIHSCALAFKQGILTYSFISTAIIHLRSALKPTYPLYRNATRPMNTLHISTYSWTLTYSSCTLRIHACMPSHAPLPVLTVSIYLFTFTLTVLCILSFYPIPNFFHLFSFGLLILDLKSGSSHQFP